MRHLVLAPGPFAMGAAGNFTSYQTTKILISLAFLALAYLRFRRR